MVAVEIDLHALQATAVSTAVLLVTHLGCIFRQGSARVKAGSRPPEDGPMFGNSKQNFTGRQDTDKPHIKERLEVSSPLPPKPEDDMHEFFLQNSERYNRLVMNNLENILIGLIVAWGTLLCAKDANTHVWLVLILAVSRFFYAFAYAFALQPHRTICWLVALLAIIGMMVNGLVGVFSL
eukprot:c5862_g1_i1.p1 GENE.c5862_g1_i1~~c5862_g1_i1.p1  ORF type:complete len:180 (+),score=24.16 c5862_g1_i1:35-574(+)